MSKKLDHFEFPAKLLPEGRILPMNPKRVRGLLAFYEPCDVLVHIERRKRGRTNAQNAYYWAVVLPEVAPHTGHSIEDLHEVFKAKFLSGKQTWRGTELRIIRSTTDLTSDEFAEYLSKVILEANELGIQVPQADKNWDLEETLETA